MHPFYVTYQKQSPGGAYEAFVNFDTLFEAHARAATHQGKVYERRGLHRITFGSACPLGAPARAIAQWVWDDVLVRTY